MAKAMAIATSGEAKEERAGRCPKIHDSDDSSPSSSDEAEETAVDDACATGRRFLGLFPPRYLRTFSGLLHTACSTLALAIGNWLVMRSIFLGHDLTGDRNETLRLAFFASACISGLLICTVFWDQVQSFQLSTTSMEARGLTPKIMKNFNRGRGGVGMVLQSGFPLLVMLCDRLHKGGDNDKWLPLEDVRFSRAVALLLITGAAFSYRLGWGYGNKSFWCYGMNQLGLGAATLRHGSIGELLRAYPRLLLKILEPEAYFVITSVQFGFLWYYLYSRGLVSKATVRRACTLYHSVMMCAWCLRLNAIARWNAAPWMMWPAGLWGSLAVAWVLRKIVELGSKRAVAVVVAGAKAGVYKK